MKRMTFLLPFFSLVAGVAIVLFGMRAGTSSPATVSLAFGQPEQVMVMGSTMHRSDELPAAELFTEYVRVRNDVPASGSRIDGLSAQLTKPRVVLPNIGGSEGAVTFALLCLLSVAISMARPNGDIRQPPAMH